MANEALINQKQEEILIAQESIRQARIDIENGNIQLKQASISISQSASESTKESLLSALETSLDAYDSAVQNYETKLTEYKALTDISNYNTLKGQVRNSKNTHSQLLFDLKKAKENDESLTSIISAIETNANSLEVLLTEYNAINDPRYLVNSLNDNTPFLLLPIKVESRYMTVKHVQRLSEGQSESNQTIEDKKELWLRFFPDDIAINTHEIRLTEQEEIAGHFYWESVWDKTFAAEGEENIHIAAWRSLVSAYGKERAAYVANQTEPLNILVVDPDPNEPNFPVLELKPAAWTDSPKSKVLPDRFVVRIYEDDSNYREVVGNNIADPLYIGMSPEDDIENTYLQEEGEILFPPQIKWMSDFSEAVNSGMGMKISLEGSEQNNIARIIVLGLKLDSDKTESTTLVEELIENHHYTPGGFSFIKQGTPTNNTDEVKSGYNQLGSAIKESYNVERNGDLFSTSTNLESKKDGQWFADLLGLNINTVQNIENSDFNDVGEAIAMNKTLWPATMGYYIKQMMQPHISSSERENIRTFFSEYVLGRGKIPAFRIKNQPYGVITSTAYSRWTYPENSTALIDFYKRMNQTILQPMNYSWGLMAKNHVKNINDDTNGTSPTPSELFLDIISLHASSVQYHQRYANGTFKMWNLWRYIDDGTTATNPLVKLEGDEIADFLTGYNHQLSMTMSTAPKVFELNFLDSQRLLNGPVIDAFDNLPYSETRGIQKFPGTEWNYIHWLISSTSTIDKIKTENFDNIPNSAQNQTPPKALLYLLLRYAYLQQYLNSATGALATEGLVGEFAEKEFEFQNTQSETPLNAEEDALVLGLVTEELTAAKNVQIAGTVEDEFSENPETSRQVKRARHEVLFNAAQTELQQSINSEFNAKKASFQNDEEKWNYISSTFEALTGELSMEEYLDEAYSSASSAVPDLIDFKDSLEKIKDLPTARLERGFAEHVDLCSYRLDAWMNGMVNQRLESQQNNEKGLFLGAFGLLENLAPDTNFPGIHVVEVDANGNELTNTSSEVTDNFVYKGTGSPSVVLERDVDNGKVRVAPRINSSNQGYIHTPSINHAVTAAILRAGYLSHQDSATTDDTLSVNLTSKRVRRALYYLEGLRNGQTLPSLLGYRLEREIHEKSLDQYILDLRLEYPLVAGKTIDTSSSTSIENIEARNVIDALALANAYEINNNILDSIPSISTNDKSEIYTIIDQLMNDIDAISDLMLSESVYQMAKGNSERSGAVLKALGEGNPIQEPEIVETPRSGNVLTHRFGIQFDSSETGPIKWTATGTARSFAEPALNGWLATQLPAAANIIFDVTADDISVPVYLDDLMIEPIDFIHIIGSEGTEKDVNELSSRILYYVKSLPTVAYDSTVKINYLIKSSLLPPPDQYLNNFYSLLQLFPLIKSIKNLIGSGRPWESEDYLLAADASVGIETDTTIPSPDPDTTLTTIKQLELVIGSSNTTFDNSLFKVIASLSLKITEIEALTTITTANQTLFNDANDLLIDAANFGVSTAVPVLNEVITTTILRDQFIVLLEAVKTKLNLKINDVNSVLTSISTSPDLNTTNERLAEAGQILFGKDFKVYPKFQMLNSDQIEQNRTNSSFLSLGLELPVEKWIQGASKVRSKVLNYQKFRLFSDALLKENKQYVRVAQIPAIDGNDKWLGIEISENYTPAGDTLSVVMETPPDTIGNSTIRQSGIFIDEWVETIPEKNIQTGVAMNFDQPNNEAPNSLILAVTPEETGSWEWDDLMDTLNETLNMAKKRAVEPDHIKEQIWGQALPALLAAISPNDSTPSLDFARNIVNASNGQVGYIKLTDYQTS